MSEPFKVTFGLPTKHIPKHLYFALNLPYDTMGMAVDPICDGGNDLAAYSSGVIIRDGILLYFAAVFHVPAEVYTQTTEVVNVRVDFE